MLATSCGGHNQKREIIAMKNVEMTVEENILSMKVDLSKEFGP